MSGLASPPAPCTAQNLEDTLIFALPELTISNEMLKMNLLAELHPDVQRSVKLETNQ